MWFFPTKKEVKKEFKKIFDSFKLRDKEIISKADKEDLNKLSQEVNSNKEKIARLEGALSVILNKSQVSKSLPVSYNLKKSQPNIETKIINKVRRSRKSLVMAEIEKLSPSMSVIEMYEDVVLTKGLCSKASFYRYISSLKSQSHKEIMRQNKTN